MPTTIYLVLFATLFAYQCEVVRSPNYAALRPLFQPVLRLAFALAAAVVSLRVSDSATQFLFLCHLTSF